MSQVTGLEREWGAVYTVKSRRRFSSPTGNTGNRFSCWNFGSSPGVTNHPPANTRDAEILGDHMATTDGSLCAAAWSPTLPDVTLEADRRLAANAVLSLELRDQQRGEPAHARSM